MRILVAVLLLTLSFTCSAGESKNWIHAGMLSKHFSGNDYNETHRLIAVEYDDWYIGHYNNSYDESSFFIARMQREKSLNEHIDLGFKYGLITGYFDQPVLPMFAPTAFFDYGNVGFDITFMVTVVAIDFKFKI